jgi:hypothetical protein
VKGIITRQHQNRRRRVLAVSRCESQPYSEAAKISRGLHAPSEDSIIIMCPGDASISSQSLVVSVSRSSQQPRTCRPSQSIYTSQLHTSAIARRQRTSPTGKAYIGRQHWIRRQLTRDTIALWSPANHQQLRRQHNKPVPFH